LLCLLAIAQLSCFSMDPVDSNFIVYEQSTFLSATFELPRVNEVLLRSDLERIIDHLAIKDFQKKRVIHADERKQK
jgi:hypothetical protein